MIKATNKKTTKEIDWIQVDNRILYKNTDRYHANWKERCDTCLAPCCFFLNMPGAVYDYTTPSDEVKKNIDFFTFKFIMMDAYDPVDTTINMCPLNVDSQCIIYEDRPTICKMFKCQMRCKLL